MTREELYASIYSHDTIYCPPTEENCVHLEVELGCSWGKCTFCDFARDKFTIHPVEKLEESLKVLSKLAPEKERVFFLGENAFCLPADRLLAIMDLCRRYLPNAREFAMYARIDDVQRKSGEDLKALRAAGLTDLHIGMESGSDPILEMVNKGVTAFDMEMAYRALDRAGIGYNVTLILGLGGRAYRNLHALETARLLNRVHPRSIWSLNLKLWKGTPLWRDAKKGLFEPMTLEEMLWEERLLLSNLTVENCFYMDTTVLNRYTIKGMLPGGKAAMLETIDVLLGERR